MKILVFGGSFDPIHLGHVEIAKVAVNRLNIDKVLFIPSKISHNKTLNGTANDRLQMLKLALADWPLAEILTYEIDQPTDEPSYSVNTLKYLRSVYPHDEIYFLMGADQFITFKTWKDCQTILKLCKVVVYRRDNIDVTALLQEFSVIYISDKTIDGSSTLIRKDFLGNKCLHPDVYQYILNHGLYADLWLKPLMSEPRYLHSMRVAKCMQTYMNHRHPELSLQGWVTGLYHDIAKDFDNAEQLRIATILKIADRHYKVYHGPVGAWYLQQYGFTDKTVLSAISKHTTPFADKSDEKLSVLDKLAYCCDKLEPCRTNEDVENIEYYRELLQVDLNKCFQQLFDYLQARGKK